MATFTQLPGELGLQLVRGDEITFTATFAAIDLSAYTLSAGVYTGFGATLVDVAAPTVTKTTTTSGGVTSTIVTINLTEAQTMAISSTTPTRWYLRWVSPENVTRTILAGSVDARNP